MLGLENVEFSYGEVAVLHGVSLNLQPGEFVAFGGRNGSGKTTVTRLLMGLEKPSAGHVYLDGEDITRQDAGLRSRHIGYVFQQPERQMFRSTVYEEVAFGPQQQGIKGEALRERVEHALDACRLQHLRDTYPQSLTRGEKQRVAIASALAMQTRFLILDEPTSGQDGGDRDTLLQLLDQLKQEGIGVLFVTHDMEIIAAHCDRAIVLGQGKIVFDGTPETLFLHTPELEEWGLARPTSVALGRELPDAPYCPKMEDFMQHLLGGK